MNKRYKYSLTEKLIYPPDGYFLIKEGDFKKYYPKRMGDKYFNQLLNRWINCNVLNNVEGQFYNYHTYCRPIINEKI